MSMQGFDYSQLAYREHRESPGQTIDRVSQFAQYHAQTAVMGTVQAVQAISQPVSRIAGMAHERSYQDTYLGGGNYALERSAWRDFAHMSGLAGSGIGQALKIGGRRPEWMSQAEYDAQMGRSAKLRGEEIGDFFYGAGLKSAGFALPFLIGGGFSPAGIIAPFAAGLIADTVMEAALGEGLRERQYSRDLAQFAETVNARGGIGQRRIDYDTAREVGKRLFHHDEPWQTRIPFIGDRFRPNISAGETFKAALSQGLFRNDDLNDAQGLAGKTREIVTILPCSPAGIYLG